MAYTPTAVPDESTFTEGTTGVVPAGGEFNDASADVVAGKAAAIRITKKRAGHVNLRDAAGTELGTAASPLRTDPTGTTPQPVSGTVAATQSGTWTVQPGNTANTTAWKVDASSVAVPVTDNGGSLTVDGPLTDTQLRATAVPVSGTVTITDGSGPVTVDGTVTTTETRPGSTTSVVDLLSATDATRVLTILAANASRRGATIRNDTDAALLIREGGNASPTNYTDILPAGARYTLDYPASTGILTAYLPQVPQGQLMATERS